MGQNPVATILRCADQFFCRPCQSRLLEEWAAKDPVDRYRATLLDRKVMSEADLDAMEAAIGAELDDAQDKAERSPLPPPEQALEGVYHDQPRARDPRPRIRH